jgi:hypothetical protein
MQVHGAHTGLTPSGNWSKTASADSTSAGRTAASADQQRGDGTGGGLIGILKSRLGELPEVRPERIEEVRQALARGEYLTRSAAEATAKAILGGGV